LSDGDRRFPRPGSGWSRATLVIVLLAAVAAVIAWNIERGAQTAAPAAAAKTPPVEQARKPAPRPPDARDTSRERPERERTDRPGDGRIPPGEPRRPGDTQPEK
jgi:hypothetical protein